MVTDRMTVTSAPPHCDAHASGRVVTDWGHDFLPCMTTVGLRSFMDSRNEVRRYCAAPGHRVNAERRFGIAPAACHICRRPLVGDDWRSFDFAGALFSVCGPCIDKVDPE